MKRWQVAAALSAAVTTTKLIGDAPTLHGRTSSKKRASLFPATLRERGSGGEALLLEKRPLPQNLPNVVSWGGSAREGTSLQRSPLPRNHLPLLHPLCDVSRYGYAGGAGLHQTASDAGAVADSVKALDGGHEFIVNKKLAGVEFHLDAVKQRILAV